MITKCFSTYCLHSQRRHASYLDLVLVDVEQFELKLGVRLFRRILNPDVEVLPVVDLRCGKRGDTRYSGVGDPALRRTSIVSVSLLLINLRSLNMLVTFEFTSEC